MLNKPRNGRGEITKRKSFLFICTNNPCQTCAQTSCSCNCRIHMTDSTTVYLKDQEEHPFTCKSILGRHPTWVTAQLHSARDTQNVSNLDIFDLLITQLLSAKKPTQNITPLGIIASRPQNILSAHPVYEFGLTSNRST
jgi:hypothetical protein